MIRQRAKRVARAAEAGFTLIEMLIALLLMGFVLTSLVAITAQWLPNWHRGMARVQQDERFAFGLNRFVEDLSVAEMVPASKLVKSPLFEGTELGVTLVRTAVGPNSHPGLEVVRFREFADARGPAFIRETAPYVPADPGVQLRFNNPVILIRAPYRVTLAYAPSDGTWAPTWHDPGQLPRSVRITVRDGNTQQVLALSTAALVHVDTPAECVSAKSLAQCLATIAQAPAANGSSPSNAGPPL
jgi:general secretion pathway protein J